MYFQKMFYRLSTIQRSLNGLVLVGELAASRLVSAQLPATEVVNVSVLVLEPMITIQTDKHLHSITNCRRCLNKTATLLSWIKSVSNGTR